MRRSAEFGFTVKRGVRAAQPDLVVHAVQDMENADGPRVGFIVTKAIGTAVDRHRVSRRLRHATMTVLDELGPSDRLVIRALPGSRDALSARLEEEVQAAVRRAHRILERQR